MSIPPVVLELTKKAHARYGELLESAVMDGEFRMQMVQLAALRPLFFGPQLELLQLCESLRLREEYRALLHSTFSTMYRTLTSKDTQKTLGAFWTKHDSEQAESIVSRYLSEHPFSLQGHMLKLILKGLQAQLPQPAVVGKHLRLCTKIDVEPLKEEIMRNEVAWLANINRQTNITVQQQTNAIAIRAVPQNSTEETYEKRDGLHESVRTPLAQFFPKTLQVIEDFALEQGGGLGRVAIVRLKPRTMVFRHYDSEASLKGRDRYHLVIDSAKGSYMTSGCETARFVAGDLFFFENHIMHTAENESNSWRTHIIFDMKKH